MHNDPAGANPLRQCRGIDYGSATDEALRVGRDRRALVSGSCAKEVIRQLEETAAAQLQGPQHTYRFALLRFWLPLFREQRTRRRAWFWSAILLAVTAFQSLFHIIGVLVGTNVLSTVECHDVEGYYAVMPVMVILNFGHHIAAAARKQGALEMRMMMQWRTTFTLVHALYSADTFYFLQLEDASVSPEALICENSFSLVHILSNLQSVWQHSIMQIFGAMYIVSLFRPMLIVIGFLTSPLYLLIAVLILPMGQLLQTRQAIIEAFLQFSMARVQDNAEQIALARGGRAELACYEGLLDMQWRTIKGQAFMTGVFSLCQKLVFFALNAPGIFIVIHDLRHDTLFAEAFMYWNCYNTISQSLIVLINHLHQGYLMEVLARRMSALLDKSLDLECRCQQRWQLSADEDFICVQEFDGVPAEGPELELREVALRWGSRGVGGKVLFEGLSLQLSAGQSLLVVGETGSGKSALLRGIYGLWHFGRGSVHRCARESIICVPQRPYVYRASLRDNLMYPNLEHAADISEGLLRDALASVNLGRELRECGLDDVLPWHDILSLGQQQRLAIARSLLKPGVRLLLLDEATSALDMQNERRIYTLLRERFHCYVSVGHRPSVWQYHTHVVKIEFKEVMDGSAQARARCRLIEKSDIDTLVAVPVAADQLVVDDASDGFNKPLRAEVADVSTQSKPDTSKSELNVLMLMRRTFCEIMVPIFWRRHFWDEIKWSVYRLLLGMILSMIVMLSTMMSMSDIFAMSQEEGKKGIWGVLVRQSIFLVPASTLAGILLLMESFTLENAFQIELKRSLARRYLHNGTNAFHRLLTDGKVQNPATRITTWDVACLISWYRSSASTAFSILTAAAYVLTIDTSDTSAGMITSYFFATMMMGTVVILRLFWPIFENYRTWIVHNMQVGASVVHVRGNADAVALLRGGRSERNMAFRTLELSVAGGARFLWQQEAVEVILAFFFEYGLHALLDVTVYEMVWRGALTFGKMQLLRSVLFRSAGEMKNLCKMLVGDPSSYMGLSRLWELFAEMDAIHAVAVQRFPDTSTPRGSGILLEEADSSDSVLELEDVALRTPAQAQGLAAYTLYRGVTLRLPLGGSMVIVGESGIGKSSLLRAVVGLWCSGAGTIRRASDHRSFFVAQRPYMCVGALRAQLLYPRIQREDVSDERLCEVLRTVQLEHLLLTPGLDNVRADPFARVDEFERNEKAKIKAGKMDNAEEKQRNRTELPGSTANDRWWNKLSLGEMQRMSFARLLLREGLQLVFLDEATSALSPSAEERLYDLLKHHSDSYVSVGHRPQVRRFHERVLEFRRSENSELAEHRVLSVDEYERQLAGEAGLVA